MIGRHNALDKAVGAKARGGVLPRGHAVLLTSRLSVEMVQKAAVAAHKWWSAVSAPTALAVRTAAAAGITLVAVARSDSFEVFTHSERDRAVSLGGVILCGGRSSRFGSEKAIAETGRPTSGGDCRRGVVR